MKKTVFVLLVIAIGAYLSWRFLQPAPDAFQLEEGYRLLYDGESLEGWRVVGGQATFEADGESIVGRRGPGDNTFLRTEERFGDFSLKLQMRWDEPGNSGVMFRANQRGGDGRTYGYQYELDPSERAWSGGIYDEARRGWLANLEKKPQVRQAIRLDDWNDIEIEARGTRLKTWINGVPAVEMFDGLDAEGFIALQVHAGKTGALRWRHIRLKELPPLRYEGDNLMQAAEWRSGDLGPLAFSGDALGAELTGDGSYLDSRRQLSDAMVQMTVPSCDSPTIIRLRDRPDGEGRGEQFAEVKIFADRAEARLVTASGEKQMEPVVLVKAGRHRFTGITVGGSVVLTVDEVDVLRLDNTGLPERGRMRIQPARCGEDFSIKAFNWYTLKEKSAEPLFYETLDTWPAQVLTPDEALSAFSIAPGFEIELVAAEPLVAEPVAMAWDEFGRLYVVELRGYMRDAYGSDGDAPVGQVVRLEDTDGDGRMDTSEVFLGGLVSARAVAVVNEGVLIGEPPNLWLCELPTRDALCDDKRRIGAYAVDVESNVEHMENGLRRGLDNWLYNAKSSRSLRIENGELLEREGPARGQWGITQDDVGRLLYNHNSTWMQADLFAGEDLVQPGRSAQYKGLGVNLTAPAEVYSVRVNPGVNRAYLDGTLREDGRLNVATGVSGLVAYRGDQFPEQYRGDVFVPESAGNVVAQFAMSEEGIGLKATQRLYDDERWGQRDFLGSTDERFRPVDAMNGPDGALYIIDMYRGIIQDDHFMTDQLREQVFQRGLEHPIGQGRIWRVRHIEGKSGRGFPGLGDAGDAELLAALQHPNGWVRDTAQRLLLARGGDHTAALAKIAAGENTIAALHAIWTLQGRGELERDLVMELAVSGDLHRQVQALRAGAGLFEADDLLALQSALERPPAALGMQLAFAMGHHADKPRVRAALAMLVSAELASPYVRQAVVRAVSGREFVFLQEYLASGQLGDAGAPGKALLKMLADNAYRSLRGDLTDDGSANPELLDLLALAESRPAWQQVALLKGMQRVARTSGFVPAHLEEPPTIFSDGSIGEDNPLWSARLAARVAFTWPGDEIALGMKPLSPSELAAMAAGEKFYPACAACHGGSGEGIAGLAPALAGADWVTGPPEWLARIILQGMTGPVEVAGETFDGVMPPHGHLAELDDTTLAGLMTYLRRSWGNKADPVSVATVAGIRAASAGRKQSWTATELKAVSFDRGYNRFEGKFAISFVTFNFTAKPDGLYLSVPMYGSGLMDVLGPTRFRAAAGGEDVEIEFVVEPDGAVNSLILHRNGEEIPVKRKH
jgi:mono/diheme cytochrome c family protein